MKGTRLLRVAGRLLAALLVACGAAELAWADLAYAYAKTEISNFQIAGAIVTMLGPDPVEPLAHSQNEAEFDGAPTDVKSATFVGFHDWSASQAKAGPGPFPGEDEFGISGISEGARADNAVVRSVPVGGFDGFFVAEARRTTVGVARGESSIDTLFFIDTVVPMAPVTFSFDAFTSLLAQKSGFALATAQSEYVLELRESLTDQVVLKWMPGFQFGPIVDQVGTVTNVNQPYNLNKLLSAEGDGAVSASFIDSGFFSLTFEPAFGQQFELSIFARETAVARVFEPPVPEPAAGLLFASGMLAVGFAARRRLRALR